MRDTQLGRAHILRFDTHEEIYEGLTDFVGQRGIDSGLVTGLGAAYDVELGFFDRAEKRYLRREVKEEVEILSLTGNIALKEGKPYLHAHIAIGLRDFTMLGGHLFRARAGATCEVTILPFDGFVRRELDQTTGLYLFDL